GIASSVSFRKGPHAGRGLRRPGGALRGGPHLYPPGVGRPQPVQGSRRPALLHRLGHHPPGAQDVPLTGACRCSSTAKPCPWGTRGSTRPPACSKAALTASRRPGGTAVRRQPPPPAPQALLP